jgi:hypothetical protein
MSEMVGIDDLLFYVPIPLLGSNSVLLLILLTPVFSWCFVKHHAMQVYGGGTVCLHSTLLNKSTNGFMFEE